MTKQRKTLFLQNRTLIITAMLFTILSSSACMVVDRFKCNVIKGGRYTFDNYGFYCDTSKSDQNEAEAEVKEDSLSSSDDLAACLVDPADYKFGVTNHSDGTSGSKRSCNARGNITNTGKKEIIFAVYRVNHYGAAETFGEHWMGAGFKRVLLLERQPNTAASTAAQGETAMKGNSSILRRSV